MIDAKVWHSQKRHMIEDTMLHYRHQDEDGLRNAVADLVTQLVEERCHVSTWLEQAGYFREQAEALQREVMKLRGEGREQKRAVA